MKHKYFDKSDLLCLIIGMKAYKEDGNNTPANNVNWDQMKLDQDNWS